MACIFVGPSPMIFHLDIWTLNLNIPLFGGMAWPPLKTSDEADIIINFYINNAFLVASLRNKKSLVCGAKRVFVGSVFRIVT